MKRWKVEVDETIEHVNTYIFEAETEEAIGNSLNSGSFEGMIERTESIEGENHVSLIRTIKPL